MDEQATKAASAAPDRAATGAAEAAEAAESPREGRADHQGSLAPAETAEEAANVDFRTESSLRYHSFRRDFFERLDKGARAAAFFAASGAVGAVVADSGWALWLAIFLAAIQAAMLAWNPGEAARHHTELYRKYSEVAERIAYKGMSRATSQEVLTWDARLTRIEADERPLRLYVWAQCWNEQATRIQSEDPLYLLTRWQRWTKHYFCGDVTRLRRG